MKYASRLMALGLTGLLSLTLVGCSGGSSSSSSGGASKEEASQQQEKETEAQAEEEAAPTSKVAVSIDAANLGTDYEGNPVAIVTYTFTNVSSEEAESFMVDCIADVYQNGVECELGFATGLEGDISTKVKTGASTTFQQAYVITDTAAPIEVEVKEMFSWDDTVLASATLELS